MKIYIILLILFTWALNSGCTRSKELNSKIKIQMPYLVTESRVVNSQNFNPSLPENLDEYNCFMVVIQAPHLDDTSCEIRDGQTNNLKYTQLVGQFHGLYQPGQFVEIDVPSELGSIGEVGIIGMKSATGVCDYFYSPSFDTTNYTRPTLLGSSEVDYSPVDKPIDVKINITYSPTNFDYMGHCEGPAAPGGGDPANDSTGSFISYGEEETFYIFDGDNVDVSPQAYGEVPIEYELSGILPNGLIFDANTGRIYGVVDATTPVAKVSYIVTAHYPDFESTLAYVDIEVPKRHIVNSLGAETDSAAGDGQCTDGSGNCSLLGALQEANAVDYNVHIMLQSNTYSVTSSFNFNNANAIELHLVGQNVNFTSQIWDTIIDSNTSARILDVNGANSIHIVKIRMQEGGGNASHGGAINFNSSGDLRILESGFYNNALTSASVHGGAIYAGTAAHIEIDKSVFFQNTGTVGGASEGGAIFFTNPNASLSIENTKFRENQAFQSGAIYFLGESLSMDGVEFYNNSATSGSGGALKINMNNSTEDFILENIMASLNSAATYGGFLEDTTTSTSFKMVFNNSGFVQNSATTSGRVLNAIGGASDIFLSNTYIDNNSGGGNSCQSPGSITSVGNNIGDNGGANAKATCNLNMTSDLGITSGGIFTGTDNYMALEYIIPASIAVGAGNPSTCAERDIRGFKRPYGGTCDIGPFQDSAIAP